MPLYHMQAYLHMVAPNANWLIAGAKQNYQSLPNIPPELLGKVGRDQIVASIERSASASTLTNRFGEALPEGRNAGLGSKSEVCIGGRVQRPRLRWKESEFQLS